MDYLDTWMKGQKLTKKQRAKLQNNLEFRNTLNSLLLMTLSCFTYEGTPDTWNSRMFEMANITGGSAILAKLDNGAYVALKAAPDGSLNLNGDAVGAYGYGMNGFNKHFNLFIPGEKKIYTIGKQTGPVNAILCKDSELMYPFINYLVSSALRITDAKRSIDVLAYRLKSPNIITCDENRVEDVRSILDSIDDNVTDIVGIGTLPYDKLDSIDTGANPASMAALYDHLSNLESEIMERIGIYSNPSDRKKERDLVDEVNANNEQTDINIFTRLKTRQEFCSYCKEFWGLDINVKINENLTSEEGDDDDSDNTQTRNQNGSDIQPDKTRSED